MKYDTREVGLEKVFKWYLVDAYRHIIDTPIGVSTRDAWTYVNSIGRASISRASIINGLSEMADMGILSYEEPTGKGGHRRVYFTEFTEEELKDWVIEKLLADFKQFKPDSKHLEGLNTTR